jgi:vitamin B12 transporter
LKLAAFLCTTTALAAPLGAAAAEPPLPSDVEAVVVTAARSERSLEDTPASIAVLDRRTLERRQTVIVADALAQTPGVAVNRNGGPGGVTSVRIRGAESDQTVVLIDGVKLNDPASVGGGFDFATLLAGDAETIEVLRGPQSVLYGSQAIGGVINVLTDAPAGRAARVSAEGGSRDTVYLRGSTAFGSERVRLRLAAGRFTTEGVSAFNVDRGGRELDGFRQTHATARADLRVTETLALDLRAFHADSRTEFDGFAPPDFSFGDTAEYGERGETVAYAGLTHRAGPLRSRLGLALTDTTRDNFDPEGGGSKTFESRGRNERLEYQGTAELPGGSALTFGLETERSRLRTASPFSGPLERRTTLNSLYAQGTTRATPDLLLLLGFRRDDHQAFGGATTGQAGLIYARGATTVRANYGGGFKAPSLFQLFSEFGNAALQPETADGFDLGVERRLGERFSASAVVFARRTEDQIDFVFCADETAPGCAGRLFGGFYDNLDEAEARGLELAVAARPLQALSVNLAYTFTRAENTGEGDPNQGRDLPRRPEHAAYAEADYSFRSGASLGLGVQYVGQRFDDAANAVPLESYLLLQLRGGYPLRDGVELFARVENLLDEAYEDVRLYGTPRRGGFAGVRLAF